MSSVTQNPEFQIPVVDTSAFLQNPSSPEAQIAIDSVRAACTTSDFFQPRESGISEDLVKALFQGAKALFALSLEEKKTLKRPGTKRGYDIMGAQALQHGALPDMKEGYYIGKGMAIDTEQTSRSFMTPNIWPSVKRVPEAVFKKPMVDYYGAVEALCLRL
ncbi:non-heme dioxygenase in morphine synthesis N-terminal-domain-containing protein [Phyllosticta citriasiana]|uniref:Non-heme dioxygenase in morphine synthesis N-terminal-domain-containing protein n=1 Tax=Phyllosticta citriasiana TaxID=595635 RepID=A0ABR1KNY0_9PEZI